MQICTTLWQPLRDLAVCLNCQGKCTLQNAKLYVVCKFKTGLTKLKKAATVLCDRRVFLSIALFLMFSFSAIVGQEVSIHMHIIILLNVSVLLLNVSVFHYTVHKLLFMQQLFSLLKLCSWRIQYGWK